MTPYAWLSRSVVAHRRQRLHLLALSAANVMLLVVYVRLTYRGWWWLLLLWLPLAGWTLGHAWRSHIRWGRAIEDAIERRGRG